MTLFSPKLLACKRSVGDLWFGISELFCTMFPLNNNRILLIFTITARIFIARDFYPKFVTHASTLPASSCIYLAVISHSPFQFPRSL